MAKVSFSLSFTVNTPDSGKNNKYCMHKQHIRCMWNNRATGTVFSF